MKLPACLPSLVKKGCVCVCVCVGWAVTIIHVYGMLKRVGVVATNVDVDGDRDVHVHDFSLDLLYVALVLIQYSTLDSSCARLRSSLAQGIVTGCLTRRLRM